MCTKETEIQLVNKDDDKPSRTVLQMGANNYVCMCITNGLGVKGSGMT